MLRASIITALLVLCTACGSGVHFRLFVSFNAPPIRTDDATIILSGVAGLPRGSVRTGGTITDPIPACRPGTFSMFWTNDANGTSGAVFALWDCPADHLTWRTDGVPLAPGANRITITMVDASERVAEMVTVTRR